MLWPTQETFSLIEPFLPPQLITPEAFSYLKKAVYDLPDAFSSYFLECRLEPDNPQVDLLASVIAERGGRKALLGGNETILSELQPLNLPWQHLNSFLRSWTDPTSLFSQQIPNIWLEFDGKDLHQNYPHPNFLCRLEHEQEHPDYPRLTHNTFSEIVSKIGKMVLNAPFSPKTLENLDFCFQFLPEKGKILHISIMTGRQPPTIKLNILLPQKQLIKYLDQIKWTGQIKEAEQILETFCTTTNRDCYQLIIGDSIAPNLEIEFVNGNPHAPNLQMFPLNLCVDRGLCTPQKREALLSWTGLAQVKFQQHNSRTTLMRWLAMKIVYHPTLSLKAKAYLGFSPKFSIF